MCTWLATGCHWLIAACSLPASAHLSVAGPALPKTKGVNAILYTRTRQTLSSYWATSTLIYLQLVKFREASTQFRMASVSFFTPDIGGEENPSEDQEESHPNPGLSAPYEVIRREKALKNLFRSQFSQSSKSWRWRQRCPVCRERRARPPTVYPLVLPSLRSK